MGTLIQLAEQLGLNEQTLLALCRVAEPYVVRAVLSLMARMKKSQGVFSAVGPDGGEPQHDHEKCAEQALIDAVACASAITKTLESNQGADSFEWAAEDAQAAVDKAQAVIAAAMEHIHQVQPDNPDDQPPADPNADAGDGDGEDAKQPAPIQSAPPPQHQAQRAQQLPQHQGQKGQAQAPKGASAAPPAPTPNVDPSQPPMPGTRHQSSSGLSPEGQKGKEAFAKEQQGRK